MKGEVMKTLFFLVVGTLLSSSLFAGQTYVDPYIRNNGTYVPGHVRTTPNNTTYDNWSTKGNANPYTGQKGYTDPYRTNNSGSSIYKSPNYNSGY